MSTKRQKRQKQLAELSIVWGRLADTQALLIELQQNEIKSLESLVQVLTGHDEDEEVTIH